MIATFVEDIAQFVFSFERPLVSDHHTEAFKLFPRGSTRSLEIRESQSFVQAKNVMVLGT